MNNNELIDIFQSAKIRNFTKKTSDCDLPSYIKYCVDHSIKDSNYLFIEFGVFTGNTFNMIRSNLDNNITLYGFDTFTGLTEDWMIDNKNVLYKKGTFSLDYIPSDTDNAKFIVGNTMLTLDSFLDKHKTPISFIHFDMDLYNPTYFALDKIYEYLIDGTILVFDDFYNLPGWENHSFKALLNFINKYNINFEPISTVGWQDGWASAAIKIII